MPKFPERDDQNKRDIRCFEDELRRPQVHLDRMQVDAKEDAKAVNSYLNKVHEMVVELHAKLDADGAKERSERVHTATLHEDARKGDKRVEASSSDICQTGEIVIIGGKEARTAMGKESLIFRFPLEHDHPQGVVVRPMANEEFLREEEMGT